MKADLLNCRIRQRIEELLEARKALDRAEASLSNILKLNIEKGVPVGTVPRFKSLPANDDEIDTFIQDILAS